MSDIDPAEFVNRLGADRNRLEAENNRLRAELATANRQIAMDSVRFREMQDEGLKMELELKMAREALRDVLPLVDDAVQDAGASELESETGRWANVRAALSAQAQSIRDLIKPKEETK